MNQPSDSAESQSVHATLQDGVEHDLLRGKLLDGALWVSSMRWGTLLFSLPITIALARLLTPQDFGYLALVGVFTHFASLVAQGGLPNIIILGETLSEEKYRRLHGWSISFYVAAFAGLLAAATPMERAYGTPGLRWVILSLSGTLILEGLSVVPVARMRRGLRLRELSIFDAASVLTNGIVALVGAFAGMRYWALVLGYVTGRLMGTILVLRAYALPPARPRLLGVQKTLKNAGHLLVAAMSRFIAESSDALIGAAVIGTHGLGGYRFMLGLASAPLQKISGILLYVAASALGNIREDIERLRAATFRMVRLTAILMFPIYVGIALISADLVEGVLGEKWMPFLATLQVYCLYASLRPLAAVLQEGTVAAGATRVVAGTGLLQLFILPPSFFLLGERFGATGLAVSWLLPMPLIIARLILALRERIGFGWSHLWDAIFQPFLSVAVMAAGVMVLDYVPLVASAHPLGRLVIQAFAGTFIYMTLVLKLQKKDIQWGLEVAGTRIPARLRRFLERWI